MTFDQEGLPPPVPDRDHELTSAEFDALSLFIRADIMRMPLIGTLRQSWGLCDRHAWAQAMVELTLSEPGEARTGRSPLILATLYEDLLTVAIEQLSVGSSRSRNEALAIEKDCPICAQLTVAAPAIGLLHIEDLRLARAMGMLRSRVRRSNPVWNDRICPDCALNAGHVSTTVVRCRSHLTARHVDAETFGEVDDQLRNVRFRLRLLIESLISSDTAVDLEVDSSWVEALGWFHGWSLPVTLNQGSAAE